MNIYIYLKNTENASFMMPVIDQFRTDESDIYMSVESRRSFREFEKIKDKISGADILTVYDIKSLGLNDADIVNQLMWFSDKSIKLVICNMESTYAYGLSQPMNKAILFTIAQSVLKNNRNILQMPVNHRKNSGRNKIVYPDNWEDLYSQWSEQVISSKEFLDRSGLKKATFYNLLTDYKTQLKELDDFRVKYKLS